MRWLLSGLLALTLASPAWAGVTFDKVDDFLTCGTTDDIFLEAGAVTVSAWINVASSGEGTFGRVIARSAATGCGFGVEMSDTMAIGFIAEGATCLEHISSNNTLTANTWTHVLFTWDGTTTATNAHVYINGTEPSYQTAVNGVTMTNSATFTTYIGNRGDNNRTTDGKITEVAVWNAVVSAQDIATLALSRGKRMALQILPANLKAYWALDQISDGASADAATFIDFAGGGHTCTGDNGANNTGLTAVAEAVSSYP